MNSPAEDDLDDAEGREHDLVLRKISDRFTDLLRTRKLGRSGLGMLGNTWVAGPISLGSLRWQSVKAMLPKDAVPLAAYLWGHRYLKLNRPKDAKMSSRPSSIKKAAVLTSADLP